MAEPVGCAAQRGRDDCGPAAAASLAARHGCPESPAEIIARFGPAGTATSLQDLATVLETLGLRTVGLRATYAGLAQVPLPALAHLAPRRTGRPGHFVLVDRWSAARVTLLDPASPRRPHRRTRAAFERRWSGALLVVPEEAPGRGGSPWAMLRV